MIQYFRNMIVTLIIVSFGLFFAVYSDEDNAIITYDKSSIRVQGWELEYALYLCKDKDGIMYMDIYHSESNFVTCNKDEVTFKMDIPLNSDFLNKDKPKVEVKWK